MGVKTYFFGPPAWRLLEGVAVSLDRALEHYRTSEQEHEHAAVQSLGRKFFYLLGFMVPCPYCRVSYQSFTYSCQPCPDCNVDEAMQQKDGAKRLVYTLHNRVNRKLEEQERDKYATEKDAEMWRKCQLKWQQNYISYEDALRQRYVDASQITFWHACTQFLAFVLCDWRPLERYLYFDFFASIGQILLFDPLSTVHAKGKGYLKALQHARACWKGRGMEALDDRILMVYDLRKAVFRLCQWPDTLTAEQFLFMTKNGIVGCTTSQKKTSSRDG